MFIMKYNQFFENVSLQFHLKKKTKKSFTKETWVK